MKAFCHLFRQLEETTSTNKKVSALASYMSAASDADKVWTIALFTHRRPRRTVTTTLLRQWAAELAEIPHWLFEETYHIVGDLAETIAKVLPQTDQSDDTRTLSDWLVALIALRDKEEEQKREFILSAWDSLDADSRFLFNKLITGGFRLGVSQRTIVKALAQVFEQDQSTIAHKLMGNWDPLHTSFEELLLVDDPRSDLSKPYPFYLASALEGEVESLGECNDWFAEYKWDGMRGQLIKRGDDIFLWSRGEELITHQFPEFDVLSAMEGDFVIDGELIVCIDEKIMGFDYLQKRMGRKNVSKKMLASHPVKMISYDIMELDGSDLRDRKQSDRRKLMEQLVQTIDRKNLIDISPLIPLESWDDARQARDNSRENTAEGLMLKSKQGAYKTGRRKGDWYKWKVDPMIFDGVLLYAQRGHGRRANLFSDFTFAVKNDEGLIPITKSYIGLTDAELLEISRFVQNNTIEKFGPVCSVRPELVFEIGFEGISISKRKKAGVSLRSPRILRMRHDKTLNDIDSLADIMKFFLG